MQATCQRTQLAEAGLQFGQRVVQRLRHGRRGAGVRAELGLGGAEDQPERGQPLLRSVVEVALE